MKKYFITGLALFLPIGIPIILVMFLFRIMTDPFLGLIEWELKTLSINPIYHDVMLWILKCLFLVGLFFFITLLGLVGHHYFSKWFLTLVEKVFLKIPVIKTIYRITVEITKSFLSTTEKPFKKSVLLNFPSKDSLVYGFYTGDCPKEILKKAEDPTLKNVFLPTAPHPISGFLFMVKESNIKEVDISIEEIFKTLISCGVYNADDAKQQNDSSKD
jgi:uncharacterized membrane protein